jgi:hypothetical protein
MAREILVRDLETLRQELHTGKPMHDVLISLAKKIKAYERILDRIKHH